MNVENYQDRYSFRFSFQWAFFGGQGNGWFEDIDIITMFADYRVPQVLVHFGAMSYDDHLMNLLQEGEDIRNIDSCFLNRIQS